MTEGDLGDGALWSVLSALLQVVLVDLVMAADNAIVVGIAVSGLPATERPRAMMYGIAAATLLRIAFAMITTQLLQIIGLLLAGGLLLLWVCWKLWRELHKVSAQHPEAAVNPVGVPGERRQKQSAKTMREAIVQISVADVSMSLDNVLAVAGVAREHPAILAFGLVLSVALMAFAATLVVRLLGRYRSLGYLGIAVIGYVALHMIWEGAAEVVAAV